MRRLAALLLIGLTGCTQPSVETDQSTIASNDPTTTVAATASIPAVDTGTTISGDVPASATSTTRAVDTLSIEIFALPAGSRPHDVAPAADGGVWYTAQGSGELGWLDPETGETRHIPLGLGSRPHGVIVGDGGKAWVTDGGLNAIVSFDPETEQVSIFPLPDDTAGANLNTASFDGTGILWFTGQSGVYGSLDPGTGETTIYSAPGGRGPYGITTTPDGSVFYASLAGSYVGAIQPDGSVVVLEPPTEEQGARRVWSDSKGSVWVSEWNSGNLSRYRPDGDEWATWRLPGDDPATYAVFVDEADIVWVSDFGSNSIVRFDPAVEEFNVYLLPHDPGEVRQLLGRPGEVWGAESAADHLILIRTVG